MTHPNIQQQNKLETKDTITAYSNHSSILQQEVGSILVGQVIQGGEHPQIQLEGQVFSPKTKALKNKLPGEDIYLEVTKCQGRQISLRLLEPKGLVPSHAPATSTTYQRDAKEFMENWQMSTDPQHDPLKEDIAYLEEGLSKEEKQKLRQMGLSPDSANITVLKGIVAKLREEAAQQEFEEILLSIQEDIASIETAQAITQEANTYLPLSQAQQFYMLKNRLPITLDNLYTARYSTNQLPVGNQISPDTLRELTPKIKQSLEDFGYTATPERLAAAEDLLTNGLPLTPEYLTHYESLKQINQEGFNEERILSHLQQENALAKYTATTFQQGQMELHLPSPSEIALEIQKDLEVIPLDSLEIYSRAHTFYSLEGLREFVTITDNTHLEANISQQEQPVSSTESPLPATAATSLPHRQLLELKLKMTWEASLTLASQDSFLRQKDLQAVVDALRQYETNLDADRISHLDKDQKALYHETNQKLGIMPALPAASLAKASLSGSLTIDTLYQEGQQYLKAHHLTLQIKGALNTYEALQTAPRFDLGDSLNKALPSMDQRLEELALPITEDNKQALRILSYGQMEITRENLFVVRDAYRQVTELMSQAQPASVLALIREGINPLTMEISQLNQKLQALNQDPQLASDDSFSAFLQKLDRQAGLTKEERAGYIGIYQLLHQISKSKGKDLATIMRNGSTLTLGNLLTAERSNRHQGMDLRLDSTFGGIEQNQDTGATIHGKINQAILASQEANYQYQSQLCQSLIHTIRPEHIKDMLQYSGTSTTLEEFYDTIKDQLAPNEDAEAESTPSSQYMYDSLLGSDILQETEIFQYLERLQLQPTAAHLYTALQFHRGKGDLFDYLENYEDPSINEAMEQLTETFTSREQHKEQIDHIKHQIHEATNKKAQSGTITALDIQALKQIHTGLQLMERSEEQEEFFLPFKAQGKWNLMHLSLVQDPSSPSQIKLSLTTQSYGTISHALQWTSQGWQGQLEANQKEGEDFLETYAYTLEATLTDFTHQILSAEGHTMQPGEKNSVPEKLSTSALYRISKELILQLQSYM